MKKPWGFRPVFQCCTWIQSSRNFVTLAGRVASRRWQQAMDCRIFLTWKRLLSFFFFYWTHGFCTRFCPKCLVHKMAVGKNGGFEPWVLRSFTYIVWKPGLRPLILCSHSNVRFCCCSLMDSSEFRFVHGIPPAPQNYLRGTTSREHSHHMPLRSFTHKLTKFLQTFSWLWTMMDAFELELPPIAVYGCWFLSMSVFYIGFRALDANDNRHCKLKMVPKQMHPLAKIHRRTDWNLVRGHILVTHTQS